jgi:tRNA pseudouridine38-40 synthase
VCACGAAVQVMSLRIQLEDARWDEDPEGIQIAAQINRHLPAQIRVFAVQRVNKKFNARHQADSRMYEYYLPASVLGLALGE